MNKISPEELEVLRERFKHEFNLFKSKGFIKYFLILEDLNTWAKIQGIQTGFGRGSAAGSYISYLMGITAADPIKYKLSIDRFVTETRVQMADCDLDYPPESRKPMRKYLQSQYGEHHVCGISTFLKMSSKSVVRDVSRVFDVPLYRVNEFSKMIDEDLEEAFATEKGMKFDNDFPEVKKHALKLCNKNKALGKHAAAICISPQDLRDTSSSNLVEKDGEISINWSMKDAEQQGYLKIDILGLAALSIAQEATTLIKQNHGVDIDIHDIDFNDRNIYKQINDGETEGVFQFNTYSLTELSKSMKINCLEHMVAATAIVRPGSVLSGATEEYIARQHGKEWEKKHSVYEEILKDSYGVCVYQEQVTKIMNKIANLPMAVCEEIRGVMSKKKDADLLNKYKNDFMVGSDKMGYISKNEAESLWEELCQHSKYSFNLSHSQCYSMLSASMAWLKFYYPAEFFAACLSKGAKEKKPQLVKHIQKLGIKVHAPKVGVSSANSWKVSNNELYIPFIEIRGVGEKTAPTAQNHKKLDNGFFKIAKTAKGKEKKPKKLDKILDDLKAHSDENPSQEMLEKYFDFEIILDYNKKYPDLSLLKKNHYENETWGDLLDCKLPSSKIIRRKMKPKQYLRGLGVCDSCKLCLNCRKPIKPEFGKYNVMIVGESPSWVDDKYGVHKSNEYKDILFPTLKKAGFDESFFYKTNLLKCCLEKGSKIDVEKIEKCLKWLTNEIGYVKPNVVLAFGNGAMAAFKGEAKGIKSMNGKTEWNESIGAWVCYCVRPGTAIWGGSEGAAEVEVGIRNFVRVCRNLGLNEKSY